MSERRKLGRNVMWNTAGLGVETLAGFLVMPFLITRLGQTAYGVWIVIGSLTGYFGLLDLGIRGAVGRYVAVYHAAGDLDGVNRTVTGGFAFLLGVGILCVAGLVVCQPLFFRAFEVPPELGEWASVAYRIVAVQFALFLVGTAFDATLWGFQRFDLLNGVDIPAAAARAGLTISLVHSEADLSTLAWITLGVTAAAGAAKAVLCFGAVPGLAIRPRHLYRASLRELLGFGSWSLAANVARLSRRQLVPLLIASQLGVAWVVPYSVADRLLGAVAALLAAVTGVFTPYAAGLHATDRRDGHQRLFLTGGRHTAAIAGFLTGGLVVLGGPLIAVWLGPALVPAATLLTIMGLGELLPGTQYLTGGTLLATGRHRAVALFGVAELAAVCGLAVLLMPWFGLMGVASAVAIPAVAARGVLPLVQGCRVVGVSVWQYVVHAVAQPLFLAAVPAAVVWLLLSAVPPAGWGGVVAYVALYAVLFGIGYGAIVSQIRPRVAGMAKPAHQPANVTGGPMNSASIP